MSPLEVSYTEERCSRVRCLHCVWDDVAQFLQLQQCATVFLDAFMGLADDMVHCRSVAPLAFFPRAAGLAEVSLHSYDTP